MKKMKKRTASARPTSDANPRLRVAIVAPTLQWVGGQAVQADLLLRHWDHDREVEARFIPIDPEFPLGLRWAQRVPYLRTVLREPIYLAALWRGLRSVDVGHVFSASYWSFLLAPVPACLVARLLRKPVLINYRSGEAPDHLRRSRIAVRMLGSVARLVVPSGYLVDVFRSFGLKAQVVPNVVDLSQFRFRTRQPLRPRLLCTRGFEPYYSIDTVVRAFARVKQEFPEARLCLVGKGSLEGEIRALVEELNLRDVEFPGAVSRGEIGRYYDDADIFVNASWLDNMPVSILEAFASGLPVATTAAEGIRYLVEHERTGLLSPVRDHEALAASIVRLLRNPDWARDLALRAYQESDRYHWGSVRDQWLAVYRSILLPSRGSRPQPLQDGTA
jgi:L-malate glycosyltransferase